MLVRTIEWHSRSSQSSSSENIPLWSKFLIDIAKEQTPLYKFYNGGAGFKALEDAENKFFNDAGIPTTNKFRKAIENRHQRTNANRISNLNLDDIFKMECLQQYYSCQKEKSASDRINQSYWKKLCDECGTVEEKALKKNIASLYKKLNEAYQGSEAKKADKKNINEAYQSSEAKKADNRGGDLPDEDLGIAPSATLRKAIILFSWENFDDSVYPYKFFGRDRKKFCRKSSGL